MKEGLRRQQTTQPQEAERNTLAGSSAPQPRTCLCSGMRSGGTHRTWHRAWQSAGHRQPKEQAVRLVRAGLQWRFAVPDSDDEIWARTVLNPLCTDGTEPDEGWAARIQKKVGKHNATTAMPQQQETRQRFAISRERMAGFRNCAGRHSDARTETEHLTAQR
eukprot:3939900-Rhodomonas_salina.2